MPGARNAVKWNSPVSGVEGELGEDQLTPWVQQMAATPGSDLT